jgi:protein-tyrosine phosphatase
MTHSIALQGAPNFRDAGGYPADCGRRSRTGLLYRSGQLSEVSASDLVLLDQLGVRLACDLRSERERAAHPTHWVGAGAQWLHFDIGADLRAGNGGLTGILAADPTPRGVRNMMLDTYRQLPGACAPHLARLLSMLADGEGLPVLLFCTAGKDRTGFMVAMVQLALGVPLAAIHSDYFKSNGRNAAMRISPATSSMLEGATGHAPDQAMIDLLVSVDSDYLDSALDAVGRQYGSADAYLQACGLDPQRRSRLQALMLE